MQFIELLNDQTFDESENGSSILSFTFTDDSNVY